MANIEIDNKDLKSDNGENSEDQKPTVKWESSKRPSPSLRLKKVEAKLAEVEKEKEELKDLLLRKAAEFDNFKKRTDSEQVQWIANANADLITELLPVLDDLERSLGSVKENKDFDGLHAGVELVLKNFTKILEKRGVEVIPGKGSEFDPEKHDALMQVENDKYPSGTIVDEHLKGYMFNGRVLRHSQVLVSK